MYYPTLLKFLYRGYMLPSFNQIQINSTPFIFIFSPNEDHSILEQIFVYLAIGITLVIFITLAYILYLFIFSRDRFWAIVNACRFYIKAAYQICIPVWWLRFARTYPAKYIKIVGSFCLILARQIIPANPHIGYYFLTICL